MIVSATGFVIQNEDNESSTIHYAGGVHNDLKGCWLIAKKTLTANGKTISYSYHIGKDNYTTNWDNRENIPYYSWETVKQTLLKAY